MKTKSSGFTLIELLVVVAIIGILAAVGVVSYSGYVETTKKKSAQNTMLQISLGQVEYYSDRGVYYGTSATTCTPTAKTSDDIETNLLGGADVITGDYFMCAAQSGSNFYTVAEEAKGSDKCKISQTKSNKPTLNSFCSD